MISLFLHPNETLFPINPYTESILPTALIHFEKINGYMVTVYTFYYDKNLAIGLGHSFFPYSRFLGYHPQDIEYVAIYEKAGEETKVYFSRHKSEGRFVSYKDCIVRDGNLCIFVALNSHANYEKPGKHWRLCGLANDDTSDNGACVKITNIVKNKDHRKKLPLL